MHCSTLYNENCSRIRAVENSFGPAGRPLARPGRYLMGEGRLVKQGRRKPQTKVFFLFNDLLVYGSIVMNGRWLKKQKILPLEDIQQEDVQDGLTLKNQWLICTPRKSFYVSAASLEEKQSWMELIDECRGNLLRDGERTPGSKFAVIWIPDKVAHRCMRCLDRFTVTNRRHHCRKCGFLVCNTCSKWRAVVPNLHPTRLKRVCQRCYDQSVKEKQGPTTIVETPYTEEHSRSTEDEDEEHIYCVPNNWPAYDHIYDYPRLPSEIFTDPTEALESPTRSPQDPDTLSDDDV